MTVEAEPTIKWDWFTISRTPLHRPFVITLEDDDSVTVSYPEERPRHRAGEETNDLSFFNHGDVNYWLESFERSRARNPRYAAAYKAAVKELRSQGALGLARRGYLARIDGLVADARRYLEMVVLLLSSETEQAERANT